MALWNSRVRKNKAVASVQKLQEDNNVVACQLQLTSLRMVRSCTYSECERFQMCIVDYVCVDDIKFSLLMIHSGSSQQGSPRLVGKDQKCKLLDITSLKRVVAEGRWSSNNPDQLVHFVPLGFEAVRVCMDRYSEGQRCRYLEA
ncbi:unnamed protein product [Microthlaspi erraticum]|uniref:Uncharacterized protein n=1 Tax=Microthlaspi erraticum TaxID=1685480 RepID=A0A6D2J1J2_9BRAS|nr:unnamed protein product [Microthlaspi erraticum]